MTIEGAPAGGPPSIPGLSVSDASSGTTAPSQRAYTPDQNDGTPEVPDDCACDVVDGQSQALSTKDAAELLDVLAEELDLESEVEQELLEQSEEAAKGSKTDKAAKDDGPDNEEDDADNLSVASADSYDMYYVRRRARKLNTKALYDVYVDRVKKSHPESDTDKAPRLVKGFVDYIQHLEARINMLESKAGVVKPEPEAEGEKKEEATGEEGETTEEKKEKTQVAVREASLDTKFYFIDDQLDESGALRTDLATKKGTFRSHVDAKHLIRVAYGFETDHLRKAAERSPDSLPTGAKIWCLRIESEPLSAFFKMLVDVEMHKDNVLEMFAPFRVLFRNMGTIREHLESLEKKFSACRHLDPAIIYVLLNPDLNPALQLLSVVVCMVIDEEKDQAKSEDVEGVTESKKDDPEAEKDEENEGNSQGKTDGAKATSGTASPNGSGDDGLPKDATVFQDEKKEEKTEDAYETREALNHFRALVQFMKQYLGSSLRTYEQIKKGKITRISFPDLWMLYDAESTIYCPAKRGNFQRLWNTVDDESFETQDRQTPQAYRVLATAGGIPIRRGLSNQPEMPMAFNIPYRFWKLQRQMKGKERDSQNQQRMKDKYSNLIVYCYWIDYDTKKWGTVPDAFVFRAYDGEMEISSLEAYPVRPADTLWHKLKDRGMKFIKMTTVSHWAYEGLTVGDPRDREEISSSVVVDIKLASQNGDLVSPRFKSVKDVWFSSNTNEVHEIYKTNCSVADCYESGCAEDIYPEIQKKEIEKADTKLKTFLEEFEQEEATEHASTQDVIDELIQYMSNDDLILLLPGVVNGYALRNRKWVQLNLDNLQLVNQPAGWNDLVLPKGHKEMVQAMVEMHAAGTRPTLGVSEKFEVDLVRGKGKGCIILLHGAPGVGKTSTAECVASYTKRPLFPITCGDIGYQHKEVEDNLEKLFGLAHKWGCVLLLDEADVFLAKRNKDDVKRNGLVSVFLRILEYYPGILFLTTNRVGAIDDAFRSRIHLTLYYPPLSKKKSLKVWRMNLRRLKEQSDSRVKDGRPQIIIEKKKILDYAENSYEVLHWNGRQIRNAFQTALALAEFKAQDSENKQPVIGKDQFKTIAIASEQFDLYLKSTHGMDEERIAQRDRVRVDHIANLKGHLKELSESDDSDSDSESSSEEEDSEEDDGSDSESESSDDSSESDAKKKKKKKGKTDSKKEKAKKEKEKEKEKKKEKKEKKEKKDKKKKKEKDDS
ncbi:Fc.00g014010.m01.CDS01 [Cosmosporella sp. VM-42]